MSPSSIRLAPGASAKATITLTLARDALDHAPDPTVDQTPISDWGVNDVTRDWLSIASGLLIARPMRGTTGTTLRLPVVAAPRPVSTLAAPATASATIDSTGAAAGAIRMTGNALSNSAGSLAVKSYSSFFQLLGSSPEFPECTDVVQEDCIPFADAAAADLAHFGYAADADYVYFAIAAHGPWRTAEGIARFEVQIDGDNDGTTDAIIGNERLPDSDVFVAATRPSTSDFSLPPLGTELVNGVDGDIDTAKLHGDVMVLPIRKVDLRSFLLSDEATTIRVGVSGYSQMGEVFDSIGLTDQGDPAIVIDAYAPRIRIAGDSPATGRTATPVLLDESTSRTYPVQVVAGAPASNDLLVLHHSNATGSRAQKVQVLSKNTTATTMTLKPTKVTSTQRASASVQVSGGGASPSGKVQIVEGSRVIATVTLAPTTLGSSTATVALPRMSVGTHRLVARYLGSSTHLPSASAQVSLTVI